MSDHAFSLAGAFDRPPREAHLPSLRRSCYTPEERHERIALAAYYRAERRGFEPGREIEDWLAAEAELERALEGEHYCIE